MPLILSFVWLSFLVSLGMAADAGTTDAVRTSSDLAKPFTLLLQFLLTSPIGIIFNWLAGTFLIFRHG